MTQINKRGLPIAPEGSSCCAELEGLLSPEVFKALADPNRLALLTRLAHGSCEQTVTEVAGCCPIDLSVVSRHLRVLRDAGVLGAEKRGKEVYYRVRVREVVGLLRGLADALESCCLPTETNEGEKR